MKKHRLNKVQNKICSKCGLTIEGHAALSRTDNKTEICSFCGNKQALEIFIKHQNDYWDTLNKNREIKKGDEKVGNLKTRNEGTSNEANEST